MQIIDVQMFEKASAFFLEKLLLPCNFITLAYLIITFEKSINSCYSAHFCMP